jgi:hypothetical protein
VNLTGSGDYPARVPVVGDPGSGCSGDIYQVFNTAAFRGPATGSVGLESGNGYLRNCFTSALDMTVMRTFRLGKAHTAQIRLDLFNAPNAAAVTGVQNTMNLNSPQTPTAITNLPYDANGNLIDSRSRPRGAGFGVANAYQAPRSIQLQLRYSF